MFHKQYYRLEEAAQKLDVDVETILSMEFEGTTTLSYVHVPNLDDENDYFIEAVIEDDETVYRENIIKSFSEKYLIEEFVFNDVVDIVHQKITEVCGREPYKDKVIEAINKVIDGTIEDTFLLYAALCESKDDLGRNLNYFVAKEELDPYTPYQLSRPHVQRVIHEDGSVMILGYITERGEVVDEQVSQRSFKGLVITHTELTRLLGLKAEHDGKPTAEQLKHQLDEAKARLAELEAMQVQAICEISPKSKGPIAATFKAIKDIYPELTIDNILNQTELNGTPVSRAAIAKYLSGNF